MNSVTIKRPDWAMKGREFQRWKNKIYLLTGNFCPVFIFDGKDPIATILLRPLTLERDEYTNEIHANFYIYHDMLIGGKYDDNLSGFICEIRNLETIRRIMNNDQLQEESFQVLTFSERNKIKEKRSQLCPRREVGVEVGADSRDSARPDSHSRNFGETRRKDGCSYLAGRQLVRSTSSRGRPQVARTSSYPRS